MPVHSTFDPHSGQWQITWPGRIARHDLVYLSPPVDPMQGLPLGNGDVGVLAWCEDSRLVLAVNRCDLWDDADFGRFHNWKAEEEERSTTLRHACRLVLEFGQPLFDAFYLADFAGRLRLADATAELRAAGPLGAVSVRLFVDHDSGVLCGELETDLPEDVPVVVRVERYGSRTFSHWYALTRRDPSIGLAGTEAHAGARQAGLAHRLTSGTFAAGVRLLEAPGLQVAYTREHAHAARVTIAGRAAKRFTFVAAVTAPGPDDGAPGAHRALAAALDRAEADGVEGLRRAHAAAWKAFWLRSLMESGDDYRDSLWHLTLYYANASQRGRYPGRFINGLWGWSRDVQNWNFYFHWNQQQIYWPLNAAGHHDLVRSYLEYRFAGLPHARQDARDALQAEGAVVSDVGERRGYNSASEFANHTPVAQIALDFWRQYRFTGDAELLRRRALPYLRAACSFFASLLQRGSDGLYHAPGGTVYEGWIQVRDAITELSCARALFTAALVALAEAGEEEPEAARWRDILDHLAPLPRAPVDERCLERGADGPRLARGAFRGAPLASGELLAAGYSLDEGRVLSSMVPDESPPSAVQASAAPEAAEGDLASAHAYAPDMRVNDGLFPVAEYCPVFPCGLLGVGQGEAALYQAAVNTARLFAPDCMGWDPLPIVLARLGLGPELATVLEHFPGRWQFYANGWGHYGPRDGMRGDAVARFRLVQVRDAAAGDADLGGGAWSQTPRFPMHAWAFRHMGMESMSVLAAAMNEALLHSHDGVLRLAPAVTAEQRARFTLHAVGGFVVSAEIADGQPLWVFVESRLGGTLRLARPWPEVHLYRGADYLGCRTEAEVTVDTVPGERLLFTPEPAPPATWMVQAEDPAPNAAPKLSRGGDARLGLPRLF